MKEQRGPEGPHRALLAAAFVAVFVAMLWFPEPSPWRLMDDSWSLALGQFMHTRAQAGVDYAFTYGPLGYLSVPQLFPWLFSLRYVWAIAFALAAAAILVRFVRLLPSAWVQAAWLWMSFAVVPRSEARFPLLLVVAALTHLLKGAWSVPRLIATAGLFATLGLIKFTYLAVAGALVLLLPAGAPRARRRRVLATLSCAGALAGGALWLAAGQSLANFPRYLATSLSLARGYSGAMSTVGPPSELTVALLVLVGLALGAAFRPSAWRSPRARVALCVMAVGLFMCWKEGFVRPDPTHVAVFFTYAALAAPMIAAVLSASVAGTGLPAGAALVLVSVGSLATVCAVEHTTPERFVTAAASRENAGRSLDILLRPGRLAAEGNRVWLSEVAEWNLPRVRARVGAEPVDVFSVDQVIAIYNNFNWRPRPVFQSYSAYTADLAQLNAAFYRSPRAPRFVLTRWISIDQRFPAADDGPALLELLRRYRPVLAERDYVLLEHLPDASIPAESSVTLVRRQLRFGETLQVPMGGDGLVTLAAKVTPTWRARLGQLLFRAPRVGLNIEREGRPSVRYELIPDVASVPFLLDPLIEGDGDVRRIYTSQGPHVLAIRFDTGTTDEGSFIDGLEVILQRRAPVAVP